MRHSLPADLYKSREWRGEHGLRAQQLQRERLCRECKAAGRTTVATVVDHIIPHKGDRTLFLDPKNHRSLCKPCHDAKREDKRFPSKTPAFSNAVGEDGWPTDPRHPMYKA